MDSLAVPAGDADVAVGAASGSGSECERGSSLVPAWPGFLSTLGIDENPVAVDARLAVATTPAGIRVVAAVWLAAGTARHAGAGGPAAGPGHLGAALRPGCLLSLFGGLFLEAVPDGSTRPV